MPRPGRLSFLIVVALACGGSPRRVTFTAAPRDVAFVDVTVVPMDREGVLAHHTVVVRGDRIVAVAPSDEVALPAGVTKIDGAGKWLMPGLADMHVHAWMDEDLTMFVAAGVTTVRNMFGNELHLRWKGEIARGERLGPAIVTAGPIVDGDPPVWPGSTVVTRPEDAEGVVVAMQQAGYDFLKPYSKLSAEAYDALAAAARKHDFPVAGHVPRGAGLRRAMAAGQRSIEHLEGWLAALVPAGREVAPQETFWKTIAATLAEVDETGLPALVDETVATGTWNCPTVIVWDRFAALDDPASVAKATRWIELVPPYVLDTWDPKNDFRLQAMTAADFETLRASNALRRRIIAALDRAGARLLVGTDTGNPYVVPGAALHDEIEFLVAAGVPRPRVLRAATAGAAEYLGQQGETGVIAPGARADLVLSSTDPLAAPLPLPPDGVMIRGRWLPGDELRAKLDEIEERAH